MFLKHFIDVSKEAATPVLSGGLSVPGLQEQAATRVQRLGVQALD